MPLAAQLALLIFGSYIVGGIPFGLIIGRVFFKVDVREHGSKNIGATNVYRVCGLPAAVICFVLDNLKGAVPVLVARHFFPQLPWAIVGAGFSAIMGHTFSPFLGFKGGKGVATSLGVGFGLSFPGSLLGFAVWGIVYFTTRYVSLASIIGTPVGAFAVWWLNGHSAAYGLFCLIVTVFVIVKHRANIQRLLRGEEPKTQGKKAGE